MLFSGLACFSPSVPQAIRKLWVQNGGTLTHTDSDFRKAQFFFCNGMVDPWLSELLSRSLIVRHSSWVVHCVLEDFCMPIAAYTLDDGFDETCICVWDASAFQIAKKPPDDLSLDTLQGSPTIEASGNLLDPPTRKRPFDFEGESELQARERLKKRPRIESKISRNRRLGNPLPTGLGIVSKQWRATQHIKSVEKDQPPGPISFPPIPTPNHAKLSKAIRLFQSCISYPNALPPPKKQKKTRPSPLASHTFFWNELLAQCYPRDGTATLNLSVRDLLRAPPTKAAIFDVNESFLGRRFINLEYT